MSDASTVTVLGEEIDGPLAAFYLEIERRLAEVGRTLTVTHTPGPEFGGFYLADDHARVELREDLPPDAVRHTLAHELAHGLQRLEGWPRAEANRDLGEESPAEEVASVLQALVQCAAAELRVAPLGLDPSWEQHERHANVRYMLRAPHEGANQRGTPAWGYWTLLYAYLDLIHAPDQTRTLLRNMERAIPEAAAAGKEVAELVRRTGYATREQALACLRGVQELLALTPHVVIVDPHGGAAHE